MCLKAFTYFSYINSMICSKVYLVENTFGMEKWAREYQEWEKKANKMKAGAEWLGILLFVWPTYDIFYGLRRKSHLTFTYWFLGVSVFCVWTFETSMPYRKIAEENANLIAIIVVLLSISRRFFFHWKWYFNTVGHAHTLNDIHLPKHKVNMRSVKCQPEKRTGGNHVQTNNKNRTIAVIVIHIEAMATAAGWKFKAH